MNELVFGQRQAAGVPCCTSQRKSWLCRTLNTRRLPLPVFEKMHHPPDAAIATPQGQNFASKIVGLGKIAPLEPSWCALFRPVDNFPPQLFVGF
jgi:hypothetical protein